MVKRDYIKIKVSDLKGYEKNNKKHGTNVDEIVKSIQANTYIAPIIIDENNVILAGHGRKLALDKLQVSEAEVLQVSGLSEEQKRDFRIRDNKLTELSEWDFENIKFELDALDNKEINDLFDGVFDDLITTDEEKKEVEEDEAPEVDAKAKIVEGGDLFVLGNHRLMCGDSTKIENIEELMNGEKADLIFTDPPYGINVVGKGGNIGGSTNRNGKKVEAKKYMSIIGDNEDYDPSFIIQTFPGSKIILRGANYYANRLENSGKRLVRDKNRGEGTTFSDCELCRTNLEGIAVKKYKCTRDGMRREGESESRIHPTQKPLKLCGDIIQDYSEKGQNVVDLFGGSGSTLIACEQIGRNCLMIELDPRYIEAIIKRFHKINPDAEIKCLNRDIDLTILFDE